MTLVDGAWLDAARKQIVPDDKWDLLAFVERLVPRHHWRFRTYYFHALPFKERNRPSLDSVRAYDEMKERFARIGRLERFAVREGYCQTRTVKGMLDEPPAPRRLITIQAIEQKLVDVLLATEMTRIAWSKEAQHIVLVAGDADYVPAVIAAKDAGALVRLCYFRQGTTTYGERLFDVVDERVDLKPIFESMASPASAPSSSSRPAPPPPGRS